ncbi:hypothetical protein AMECASPLE_031015 [Ameca splendens]|uniref:Uncharacterized protein n=1 Tax=Ameca splendens TaxID=208324 RepID=A0ABV1ADQ8_9TELE
MTSSPVYRHISKLCTNVRIHLCSPDKCFNSAHSGRHRLLLQRKVLRSNMGLLVLTHLLGHLWNQLTSREGLHPSKAVFVGRLHYSVATKAVPIHESFRDSLKCGRQMCPSLADLKDGS